MLYLVCMMNVKKMQASDKEQVISLIEEFSDEKLAEFGVVFKREHVSDHFDLFISNPLLVAFVAEENGKIIGMIAGLIGSKLFASSRTLQEIGWFVSKENRRCGISLLKRFEEEAKALDCEDILMGGFMGDRSCVVYEKFGYKEFQRQYLKKVST